MTKKYKVVIHNSEATEDSDTKNVQFFVNDRLCNFETDKEIIISEAAYNNLKDSSQTRHRWDEKLQKMIAYEHKRFPVTLIDEIIEEEVPAPIKELDVAV